MDSGTTSSSGCRFSADSEISRKSCKIARGTCRSRKVLRIISPSLSALLTAPPRASSPAVRSPRLQDPTYLISTPLPSLPRPPPTRLSVRLSGLLPAGLQFRNQFCRTDAAVLPGSRLTDLPRPARNPTFQPAPAAPSTSAIRCRSLHVRPPRSFPALPPAPAVPAIPPAACSLPPTKSPFPVRSVPHLRPAPQSDAADAARPSFRKNFEVSNTSSAHYSDMSC
jgi:hypothetical protein